jgi:hypothetical protein
MLRKLFDEKSFYRSSNEKSKRAKNLFMLLLYFLVVSGNSCEQVKLGKWRRFGDNNWLNFPDFLSAFKKGLEGFLWLFNRFQELFENWDFLNDFFTKKPQDEKFE